MTDPRLFAEHTARTGEVICQICCESKSKEVMQPTDDGKIWDVCKECWPRTKQVEVSFEVLFTCPDCKRTSYHPEDVKHQYCGNCHTFPENRRNG